MKTEGKMAEAVTEGKVENRAAVGEMPVYDINESWVQEYIRNFGTEPSFF